MTTRRSPSFFASLFCVVALATACSTDDALDFDEADELDAGAPMGKYDALEMPGLPVSGNYASTTVWSVANQWEDTDTPNARMAGIAWPENSGLDWDEKYAAWLQSMAPTDGIEVAQTFELTTPWGKSLPAPKLDCADAALLLRATFAAWYKLPFYAVAFDGNTPVYFGHFGIRTAAGNWNGMPKFATKYKDHSGKSLAEIEADWPEDGKLRTYGVGSGDDQPMIGEGARTGAYLDEIHLNKRAGHFIRLLLIYMGSGNLADSRNTFNLAPESLRAGDVNLWRWQQHGVGHTMVTMRVRELAPGQLEAEHVFGNLPPNQPVWMSPAQTEHYFSDERGGGHDGTIDYAKFNGGLKRFRVAKKIGGKWTNATMQADEAAWIADSDLARKRERPAQLDALLGELTPAEERDLLIGVIEAKRAHLRDFPASCAARSDREKAFVDLYAVMEESFGLTSAEVDVEHRIFDDYVFAELVYNQSKTCCWNSTTSKMYETIMDLNADLQAQAGEACVQPVVFKAEGGDYDIFREHEAFGWREWSADEACPQANVQDDTEAPHDEIAFCEWSGAQSG
jgi:hypothetical protein